MTCLIRLDSSLVSSQLSHDFTIEYSNPIIIDDEWEAALIKCNLWYSWYNISDEFNNNTLRYNNGVGWKDVTITNGQYTITQLNDYLHVVMKANGDYTVVGGVDTFNINLLPNFSTLKVIIQISNSYQLDLTVSDLYLLLGFQSIVVTTSQEGYKTANINRDINSIQIHSDLVEGSFENAVNSNILYSFVPNQPPGSNVEVIPQPSLIYLPLRKKNLIDRIRVYLTDNLNRTINVNGEPVSVLIHLRQKR